MSRIGIHEAKTQLSKLVERAEAGEEIVITRRGEPAARLVPVRQGGGFASLAGVWQGQVRIGDDFDELPAGLAEPLGIES
jgi:prevent-host-death family protein